MRTVHQPVKPAGAIEQRKLGVQVQMDEVSVRHQENLHADDDAAQGRDIHKSAEWGKRRVGFNCKA
jgi:hypothetical protein